MLFGCVGRLGLCLILFRVKSCLRIDVSFVCGLFELFVYCCGVFLISVLLIVVFVWLVICFVYFVGVFAPDWFLGLMFACVLDVG